MTHYLWLTLVRIIGVIQGHSECWIDKNKKYFNIKKHDLVNSHLVLTLFNFIPARVLGWMCFGSWMGWNCGVWIWRYERCSENDRLWLLFWPHQTSCWEPPHLIELDSYINSKLTELFKSGRYIQTFRAQSECNSVRFNGKFNESREFLGQNWRIKIQKWTARASD